MNATRTNIDYNKGTYHMLRWLKLQRMENEKGYDNALVRVETDRNGKIIIDGQYCGLQICNDD